LLGEHAIPGNDREWLQFPANRGSSQNTRFLTQVPSGGNAGCITPKLLVRTYLKSEKRGISIKNLLPGGTRKLETDILNIYTGNEFFLPEPDGDGQAHMIFRRTTIRRYK